MKELSIEQKAEAYNKVREKIALRFGSNVAEEIFSEFELSKEERMKRAILGFLEDCDCEPILGIEIKDAIAWLESKWYNE